MRKKLCLFIVVACFLAGCSQNQGRDNSDVPESSEATSSSESGLPQSSQEPLQSQVEDYQEKDVNDASENNNPITESSPSSNDSEAFVYDERALEAELEYLGNVLSESQHGGLHRISDFNGSGRAYHGGEDKGNPYILIWVIDQNAVDAALNSYTGDKAEVVTAKAGYSLEKLIAVQDDLESSDISESINGMFISEDNRLVLDIIGQENLQKVNNFLESYNDSDAVSVISR